MKDREIEIDSKSRDKMDKDIFRKITLNQSAINEKIFSKYVLNQKEITNYILNNNNNIKEMLTIDYESSADKVCEDCLYDYKDVLELTNGSMAKVLGSTYEDIDKYKVRARMPSPPYLFVSRILNINAKYGELVEGSSIEAEYDITEDCIMKISPTTVSAVALSEAAHIGIFLAGYIGIDSIYSGKRKFRITDVSTKYVSDRWPQIGDTVKLKFTIEKIIQSANMTLLFCDFKVYLEDILIIDAKETGGFFTQEALDNGNGVKESKKSLLNNGGRYTKDTLYKPFSKKESFTEIEVYKFLAGDYASCFGRKVANTDTSYRVSKEAMFIDKIVKISGVGGRYNLGYAIAEMRIDEQFWPFKSHFKNDPVLPGTIMLEGVNQTVTFFQTYMGLYNTDKPFVTQMNTGYEVKTKFRGAVKKGSHHLVYRIDPKEVKYVENGLLFVCDSMVYCDNLQVVEQKDLAIIIK